MNYALTLSEEAKRTIEEQIVWYEADEKRGGQQLADRWLDRLETALNKLTKAPHRHGFAPEKGRWYPELTIRQMLFRSWKSDAGWRVLFVIDEQQGAITVLQVRHERRWWLSEDADA